MSKSDIFLDQIKETCLYVQDLDKTAAFYNGLLGLPIIGKVEGRHIFFRVGRQVLLCFIAEVTSKEVRFPAHYASGKQHMAFSVNPNEYANWKSKIKSLGIPITSEYEWKNGRKSFYFNDPDENVLEIVPDNLWDN